MYYMSFSCLTALARTSRTVLIKVRKVRMHVFFLISEKVPVFFHKYDVACEFFVDTLCQVEEIPFYPYP